MDKKISRFLKFGTLVSVLLLVCTVMLQIFARFFLASAPSWTEEVSRLFFIFSVAFSAALALKSNYFIFLDFAYNALNNKTQKYVRVLVLVATFVLFLVVAITSIKFIAMGMTEKSASFGFPMGIVFSSVFIMSFFICYVSVAKLITLLNKH